MSIFLGAIKKELQNRRVTFDEVNSLKTIKLHKIEHLAYDYFWDRTNKKSLYEIYDQKGFIRLQNAWEKEIESIMKKNNIVPDFTKWPYDFGDVLA
jgi:hypothetical protein